MRTSSMVTPLASTEKRVSSRTGNNTSGRLLGQSACTGRLGFAAGSVRALLKKMLLIAASPQSQIDRQAAARVRRSHARLAFESRPAEPSERRGWRCGLEDAA